jgi:hypothetical protein
MIYFTGEVSGSRSGGRRARSLVQGLVEETPLRKKIAKIVYLDLI